MNADEAGSIDNIIFLLNNCFIISQESKKSKPDCNSVNNNAIAM